MYIWTYKQNELLPEIELDDLWIIFELDQKWAVIFAQRKALELRLEEFDGLG